MKPFEAAARFAAFTWYTGNRQAPDPTMQTEASRFAKENWQAFLPVADEGWGRLLLRVAKAHRMEPIQIECDAPCYAFVEACGKLGFQSPLDVRWCRMSHFRGGRREPADGFHLLRWQFGDSKNRKTTCTCGQPLPMMECYTVILASKKEDRYLLGQCRRCRTMFWEEVSVPSRKETELGSWEV
jgi:hypothetical protein